MRQFRFYLLPSHFGVPLSAGFPDGCVLLPNGYRVRVILKVAAFRKMKPFAVAAQSVWSFIQSAEKKESFSSFSI